MVQNEAVKFLIEKFRQFLVASWNVAEIHKDESIKSDWLQANWELLVEANLFDGGSERINLNRYGEGADGSSDRVFLPNESETHNIICKPKNGLEIYDNISGVSIKAPDEGFIFNRFVTVKDDGWYYEEPPFNLVQVNDLDNAAFSIQDVFFEIKSV